MIYLYAGNKSQAEWYARARNIGKDWINLSEPDRQLLGARDGLIIICGEAHKRFDDLKNMEVIRFYEMTRGFKVAYDSYR